MFKRVKNSSDIKIGQVVKFLDADNEGCVGIKRNQFYVVTEPPDDDWIMTIMDFNNKYCVLYNRVGINYEISTHMPSWF